MPGQCEAVSNRLTDNVLKRQWYVFLVLNALKLYERGLRYTSREELEAEIQPWIEKGGNLGKTGPLLKPYLAFLYAEVERVTGDFQEARSLYLDAIDTAHEQKYTFLEGHLNECLGKLLRQAGYSTEKIYFKEAARLYKQCLPNARIHFAGGIIRVLCGRKGIAGTNGR